MSSKLNPSHRVVALVGSYLGGKTSLMEALLFVSGAVHSKGTIKAGNTVGDASPEARARQMSIEVSAADTEYEKSKFTFLDCPGSLEFMQEARNALNVADSAVVVCEPAAERTNALKPILKYLEESAVPHFIFINKIDGIEKALDPVFEALKDVSDKHLVVAQRPIIEGEKITGYVDVLHEKAYKYVADKAPTPIDIPADIKDEIKLARGEALEKLADFNDSLMEKLLEDAVPTPEEINSVFTQAFAEGNVVPVVIGSATTCGGAHDLMKLIYEYTPSMDVTAKRKQIDLGPSETLVQVFKTLYVPHKGKMSISRVWRGTVAEGVNFGGLSIGGIMRIKGVDADKISKAEQGEIFAFNRVDQLKTGGVVSAKKEGENLPWPEPLHPLFSLGLHVSKREDEMRLTGALAKIIEEDSSLGLEQNQVTKELLLSGQGEVQLKVAMDKLKNRYNVTVETNLTQIPYRETIKRGIRMQGRHKKQTGGHGQFGDVHVEVKPLPRNSGNKFIESIVGGAIPRNYFGAVEAGVNEYLEQGPLGFPVVDVAVNLVDGSYHKVDSSDLAFRLAAIIAMKEAMPKCEPTLLEPIYKVDISVPSECLSKAQKLVSGLRGQILGFTSKPGWRGWDMVTGHIPQAEMHALIIELRSLTQGLGFFTCEFDHLQELTGRIADQVIEARKKYLEEKRSS